MAQHVGSRLSRLAMRAGAAVGVAGLVAIALTPVGAPQAAALTIPYAYVANAGSGTVSVINTSTNTVVKTVGVGSDPCGVAITPNGSDAYVANAGSGTVSVINTSTNTVVKTVGVGSGPYGGPYGVAITPNGSDAYVTNDGSNTVSVIKTSTNTVVKTVGVGQRAIRGRHHPQRERRLRGQRRLQHRERHQHLHQHGGEDGGGRSAMPMGVAITPNGSDAYVDQRSMTGTAVSVIKTSTNTVVKTVTWWATRDHPGSPSPPTGATPT